MTHYATYSEQVAETLKQMLLEGRLSPGDRVHETALAEQLGISRAPIREALHMLVTEGLIIHRPQRGKFIMTLTPQEICNSYFVGGVLEGAAAAACCRDFDREDFRRMEEVVTGIRKRVEENRDMREIAPLDTDFHGIIFSRINNPLLVDISRRSCLRISKILFFRHWLTIYTPMEFYQRHAHLLQVLRTRAPGDIETALRAHYEESGRRLSRFGTPVGA